MGTQHATSAGISRRVLSAGMGVLALRSIIGAPVHAAGAPTIAQRFAYLSTHGNSNCSRAFRDSIATMPPEARLQGSCCSPMDLHRYIEQIEGLRAYADQPLIPSDPYDIPAGLAADLMASYDLALTETEQAAYDYAMQHSDEKGPCCCPCWRWRVYGGLAKRLIREHGFTGEQVTTVWNLSDGCGGGDHG
ncbi:hypothetical protein [Inquilinus sp. Marseille-Q2685]|uniref:hypothetical protein n=1 Tax=Inquilinus sp. Marseille-Q2685 TaxID=2866581 RepID=UPI001CE3D3A3|nr:hypothetical protein [Inquilinus sp. Marseille-Q2685]